MLRSAVDTINVMHTARKLSSWLSPCVIAISFAYSTLHAAEQPQLGTVQVREAILRSGPGEDFYPTARLQQGTAVEVYRVAEGGWCGIRPPEGSFSYVVADHVRVHPKNDSVLITHLAGTKTHVGSLLSADIDVEYIALQAGEPLKRLGGPLQLGQHRWYRVSPPSGEFRWIHIDDLKLADDVNSADVSSTTADPLDADPADDEDDATQSLPTEKLVANSQESMTTEPIRIDESPLPQAAAAEEALDSVTTNEAIPGGQWKAVTRTDQDRPTTPSVASQTLAVMPIPTQSPDVDGKNLASPERAASIAAEMLALERELSQDEATTHDLYAVPDPIPAAVLANAEPLQTAELELRLSQTVAQDVHRWRLSDLRAEVTDLANRASNDHTRAHALRLLDRIAEFNEIKLRHESLARATSSANAQLARAGDARLGVSQASALLPVRNRVANEASDARMQAKPSAHGQMPPSSQPLQVSAHGWLVPVETSRGKMPQFALTSEDGEILYFVSAGAGLDLRAFENQPVAMVGQFDSQKHEFALVAHRIERLAQLPQTPVTR